MLFGNLNPVASKEHNMLEMLKVRAKFGGNCRVIVATCRASRAGRNVAVKLKGALFTLLEDKIGLTSFAQRSQDR